ncbi:WXG100 family type VII secretion target [Mycobacterium sp. SMC-4]|uniref:WXG100 family type VII secretion target n=1 Tax=Mycobacterium sp. SMC-4 TaxID=2857059 RepID=UPI0021B1AA9F|nr:WXG100 family type VII secretion target [Mycobacterium sp. SMC-4]UXA18237.1 WXG100 family type VII secretion target [Mycobacterium sp. SMC-4]
MGLVNADTPQLMAEAANFDRICGELATVLAQVESTAAGLQASMNSEGAGAAAQAALIRFNEAAGQQIRLLEDISQNINISGQSYQNTDAQNADELANQML